MKIFSGPVFYAFFTGLFGGNTLQVVASFRFGSLYSYRRARHGCMPCGSSRPWVTCNPTMAHRNPTSKSGLSMLTARRSKSAIGGA